MLAPEEETDILVVGGGPAGAATAISAARAGLTVRLLEGDPGGPAARERAGETLHPGVEPILDALGVAEDVARASPVRHAGHAIAWGAAPARVVAFGADGNGPWRGFQVRRWRLEEILLARAASVGVALERPCRATALLRGPDGRVVGVATERGRRIARLVADATGGRHWLTRRMGARPTRLSRPLVARYGWRREVAMQEALPCLTGTREGWRWTAPLGDGLVAWVEACFEPARSAAVGSTADVTWRSAPRLAGPGFVLVGDAAGVLDPACSHGVLRALMSGIAAARCASATAAMPDAARDALMDRYAAWHRAWFAADAAALGGLYAELGFAVWRSSLLRR